MSTWLLSECGGGNRDSGRWREEASAVYQSTIMGMWGMERPEASGVRTVQGVDYTRGSDPDMYADAWTVRDAILCRKGADGFELPSTRYGATLVFVAGPNANQNSANGRPSSTMRRTFCPSAAGDYEFFKGAGGSARGTRRHGARGRDGGARGGDLHRPLRRPVEEGFRRRFPRPRVGASVSPSALAESRAGGTSTASYGPSCRLRSDFMTEGPLLRVHKLFAGCPPG